MQNTGIVFVMLLPLTAFAGTDVQAEKAREWVRARADEPSVADNCFRPDNPFELCLYGIKTLSAAISSTVICRSRISRTISTVRRTNRKTGVTVSAPAIKSVMRTASRAGGDPRHL